MSRGLRRLLPFPRRCLPLERDHIARIVVVRSGTPPHVQPAVAALGRRFPIREAAPHRRRRIDHHYVRNGTRKLLAVYNPHAAEVYGEMKATRTAADTVAFMEEVARRTEGRFLGIFGEPRVNVLLLNLDVRQRRVPRPSQSRGRPR